MIGSAVIVFRETLEAALIMGIIAAATRGVPARNRWLILGVGIGIVGSLIVASLTGRIADLAEGTGQELFNAVVLGIAVAMLAWHNIWMTRHGVELARAAKQLGSDVVSGTREMSALGIVIALAILREGSETVLFLYGMLAGGEQSIGSVLVGGALGLGGGVLAGFGLYAGFLRIPVKWFFSVTSGLILLLAASMSSQAAKFLVQADVLPSLGSPIWDTSSLLSNNTSLASLLHAFIGYEATPAGIQVAFYATALILILVGMRLSRLRPATLPLTQ
ncbi:MAG: FTR1 family protein [Gammaproteobacteria bacterium]|nr:FTR1 family protein [Gammaproteobacteria bacterium]